MRVRENQNKETRDENKKERKEQGVKLDYLYGIALGPELEMGDEHGHGKEEMPKVLLRLPVETVPKN